jgi:metallo-beta-lactamase class B
MKRTASVIVSALCLAAALGTANAVGQSRQPATYHKTQAKSAAGQEWTGLYAQLCAAADQLPAPSPARPLTNNTGRGAGRAAGPGTETSPAIPARDEWHHEPAKIFDNLYFVGMNDVAAWAVTTSNGIILIDALNDYAVEDEVVDGLKKLGLDPAQIKYVIVSHGHVSHFGGAKFLREKYGARVGLSAPDWDLIEGAQVAQPKPARDLVIKDGEKLRLGDVTVTMHITPGHTAGALSYLIPVTDHGKPHLVALSGLSSASGADNLKTHIAAASRFEVIAAKAGADVMISDEDHFSNYLKHIDAMASGRGSNAPFIVGTSAVRRYLVVIRECSAAILATL